MWKKFVAIGDSMTEGYGDDVTGMIKKAWPTYVAEHFEIEEHHNLGKSGLRSDEIYNQQFEVAKSLQPDLVSIMAGANDFMQRKWNPQQYKRHMEDMIAYFRNEGATVVTFDFPNFTKYAPIPFFVKPMVRKQLETANNILNELSQTYDTVHISFWNHPLSDDRKNWSNDFVHPNALGYKRIAEAIIEKVNQVAVK